MPTAAALKVLVVDDQNSVRQMTRMTLEQIGVRHIHEAENGRLAMDTASLQPLDLIISDYHLKEGRSGIDAIGELHEAFGGQIPAFLISGDITQERLRETHGATHHLLHKPVNPMTLRAIMTRLLKV